MNIALQQPLVQVKLQFFGFAGKNKLGGNSLWWFALN
jgi:hypothetical protein